MDLKTSLYMEHLEELSILYEQYRWLRKTNRIKWHDIPEAYSRMEPHVDGLVLGNEAALDLCGDRMLEGDTGECYGAVRVLVRMGRSETLTNLICRMDGADDRRFESVFNAFAHEPSGNVHEDVPRNLLPFDAARAKTAARIIAFHRLDLSEALAEALETYAGDNAAVTVILNALGRLRASCVKDRLVDLVHATDNEMRNAAIEALVRIGDRHWVNVCKTVIPPDEWPPLTLGIYGDTDALNGSLEKARPITPDHMTAAGLSGDIVFVPFLIGRLENPELTENAAQSLHMITGIPSYEDVFVPDVISEDDLFESEKEAWRNGTLYPDGNIPGKTVTRLSRDPNRWTREWEQKQPLFDPAKRYRYGLPVTPSGLLDTLKSRAASDFLRGLAHQELVIRYGTDIPFDPEMTAKDQIRAVTAYGNRLTGNPDNFEDGILYYNGSPLEVETSRPEGASRVYRR
jgi:hypothetical protein